MLLQINLRGAMNHAVQVRLQAGVDSVVMHRKHQTIQIFKFSKKPPVWPPRSEHGGRGAKGTGQRGTRLQGS